MKEEILQSALRQFLKYGIREMSILKLTEPLGISTKTIYKYYKNKEELLEAVLQLYYKEQYQQLESLAANQNAVHLLFDVWCSAIERAYEVNNIFFQDLQYYYPELEKKTEATIAEKFAKQFILIIKKGIKENTFKKDILPEVALESIFVLYDAIARKGHFNKYNVSPYELLLNTIVAYIRGICTDEGEYDLDEHIQSLAKPTTNNKHSNKLASHL